MTALSPELKTWIAENLINGCSTQQLVEGLARINVPEDVAVREIAEAQGHPYMKAVKDMKATLNRRESLMKTLDYYQRMDPDYLVLKRKKLPPFEKFLTDYVYPNRPGLFKNAVDHWPAMQWTPRKLVKKVGADTMVEVQSGRESDKEYEMNGPKYKKTMRFGDFIDQVESKESNDIYLTANNHALSNSALDSLIKDVGNIGDGYVDLKTMERRMFLWVGPKGVVTPLHHDLVHNFFIQIYGKKRLRLIPPLQVPYMYNHRHVYCRVDMLNPQIDQFPNFANATPIDIVAEKGDLLFIPTGWWHHVMGESVSITVTMYLNTIPSHFIDFPVG